MTIMELPSLIRSLTLIDDRRNNKNKRYPLPLLLLIAFCASISWGPQNEVSKGEWGKRLRNREIQKKGCKTNCPRA